MCLLEAFQLLSWWWLEATTTKSACGATERRRRSLFWTGFVYDLDGADERAIDDRFEFEQQY
jgi:hypothetical protein